MKIIKLLSLFIAALISALAATSYADEQLPAVEDRLNCGDAEVRLETTCLNIPDVESPCRKQTIQLINGRKGISKKLPHEGKLVAKTFVKDGSVLDAFIVSWACLKAKSGIPYILLSYACSWGKEKDNCVGKDREFE